MYGGYTGELTSLKNRAVDEREPNQVTCNNRSVSNTTTVNNLEIKRIRYG